jgi:hypothetical protein
MRALGALPPAGTRQDFAVPFALAAMKFVNWHARKVASGGVRLKRSAIPVSVAAIIGVGDEVTSLKLSCLNGSNTIRMSAIEKVAPCCARGRSALRRMQCPIDHDVRFERRSGLQPALGVRRTRASGDVNAPKQAQTLGATSLACSTRPHCVTNHLEACRNMRANAPGCMNCG